MDTPGPPVDNRLPLADSRVCVAVRLAGGTLESWPTFSLLPGKHRNKVIHDFDGDLSMALDRGSYISSAIYWSGHHSLSAIRFLQGFLRPEITLADIFQSRFSRFQLRALSRT